MSCARFRPFPPFRSSGVGLHPAGTRRRPLATASLPAAALLAAAPGATAQDAAEVRLGRPKVAWSEPFSSVSGLRELADGRLIVSDGLEQTVAILDLRAGASRPIGRQGEGPHEYKGPDALFPLPGDSTLLVDLGNGRLTRIAADGTFGEPLPIAWPAASPEGGTLFLLPTGVDGAGRIYFQPFGGGPGAPLADSAHIARFDRWSGAVDTLGQVRLMERKRSESAGPSSRSVRIRPVPLSPQDAWAVAPDGRVAVARADDYHLEWIDPAGRTTRGRSVLYRPVKVGRAEKEAWVAGLAGGLAVMVSNENGRMRTSFARGGREGDAPKIDEFEWPEAMPPFPGGGVRVSPEGEAWVERSVPAGAPLRYDVFDAAGSLRRTVVLPEGRRLAGFGKGAAYLVRTDELDFQWLEKYAVPGR